MDAVTKKQTIDAVNKTYGKRVLLIRRAVKAVGLARDDGVFSTFFEHALENLRLAEIQTRNDWNNQIKYWEES